MKHPLKQLFFTAVLLASAAMAGCTKDADLDETTALETPQETPAATLMRLIKEQNSDDVLRKKAVFDKSSGKWLKPQTDPYALANFQLAYDNLVSGNGLQSEEFIAEVEGVIVPDVEEAVEQTRGEGNNGADGVGPGRPGIGKDGIPPGLRKKLKPTHRVLKIWPRSEEELWALESDTTLTVSYTPYDYQAVTEEQSAMLRAYRGSNDELPDARRHTVEYPAGMSTEGPTEAFSITLPVVYVVWPTTHETPIYMDIEELYEVYLPEKTTEESDLGVSEDALKMLETEANMAAQILAIGSYLHRLF